MTAPSRPTAGSLRWYLLRFFAANPEEMLTYEDVRVKWPRSRDIVRKTLRGMEEAGEIRRQVVVMRGWANHERPDGKDPAAW
jgi:hypothetical protein